MPVHEAFNRSAFSQFLNSAPGRVFRIVAGLGFLAVGFAHRRRALGLAAMGWSVLPLTAGGFDVCYISAVLGGPFSGERIRRLATGGAPRPVSPAPLVEIGEFY